MMPILVVVMKNLIQCSQIVGTCIANFIFYRYHGMQTVLRKQVVLCIRNSKIFTMCIMSPVCTAVLKYWKVFFVCENFYEVKSALILDTILFLFFYVDLADKAGQIVIPGDIVLYSFFLIFVLPDWYVEFQKALPKYLETDKVPGEAAFHIKLGDNALAQLCLLCALNIIKLKFCRATLRSNRGLHDYLENLLLFCPLIGRVCAQLFRWFIKYTFTSFNMDIIAWDIWVSLIMQFLCLRCNLLHVSVFSHGKMMLCGFSEADYRNMRKFIATSIVSICCWVLFWTGIGFYKLDIFPNIFDWKQLTILVVLLGLKAMNWHNQSKIPHLDEESDDDSAGVSPADTEVPKKSRTKSPGRQAAQQQAAQPQAAQQQAAPQQVFSPGRQSCRLQRTLQDDTVTKSKRVKENSNVPKTYQPGDHFYVQFREIRDDSIWWGLAKMVKNQEDTQKFVVTFPKDQDPITQFEYDWVHETAAGRAPR